MDPYVYSFYALLVGYDVTMCFKFLLWILCNDELQPGIVSWTNAPSFMSFVVWVFYDSSRNEARMRNKKKGRCFVVEYNICLTM